MKQLIIIWSLILLSVIYAVSVNPQKTRQVLAAHTDQIEQEMNNWERHYPEQAAKLTNNEHYITDFMFGDILKIAILSEPDFFIKWNLVDLDRLAYAVAQAETGNCKYATKNNCFGVMAWDKRGNRYIKPYGSHQASYNDFKRIWKKGYGGRYPTRRDAVKWTGNDSADDWLRIVNYYY